MNEQQWQDIEDYNLGLQGVQNGSAYNTAGLHDRPKSSMPSYTPKKKVPKKTSRTSSRMHKGKKKSSGLEGVFFFVGAIAACIYMSNEGVEEIIAYLVGAAVAGLISAWLHKVIIGIAIFIAVLFVIGINT